MEEGVYRFGEFALSPGGAAALAGRSECSSAAEDL